MGPHEPYWRTNSSFSPPPARWDFQLQPELQSGAQQYGSSTSTNSKESRSWVRGNQLYNPSYGSDGAGIFLSGSSDTSQGPQWTPPALQEIRADDFESAARRGNSGGTALGQSSFRTAMEGTSENLESGGSTSFRSDSSGSEPKSRSFQTRRSSFMSKPIHPLSFPAGGGGQASPDFPAGRSWSSAGSSSADFADVSETFDSEPSDRFRSDGLRCGLCERLLSQRSPWGSRRIVRSGDMPVAGVLPCRHVFHAECLENTTPKARKSDPPCPVCLGPAAGEESCPDQKIGQRTTTSSRPWGSCGQAGDCVEGAFQAPTRNAAVLLNRNRVKKSLSSKSSSYSSGCSKSGFVAGPSMKS